MELIGKFGIPIFGSGNFKMILLGFTFALCVLVFLLFISGMAGWSPNYNTLENSAWATGEIFGITIYIGLQGYAASAGGSSAYTGFSECSGSASVCKDCLAAGKAAIGLLIVSFFITLVVTIGMAVRMFRDSNVLKVVLLVLSFLVWIFSVAAFGNWNENCYNSLQDLGTDNLEYAAGYGAAVSGWFFTNFIFLSNLITPVSNSSASSSAQPSSSAKVAASVPAASIGHIVNPPVAVAEPVAAESSEMSKV